MRIGFDAKRAFFNQSGLGNYSRDTIRILAEHFPQNDYILYTPKPSKSNPFYISGNIKLQGPVPAWKKLFSSYWRTYGLSKQLYSEKIDLYHGLSNELPFDIDKFNIRSVVTIHDLIFMRYPEFYKPVDRKIYERKFRYAAQHASRVIAVSGQTREDIVNFMNIPENKIDVVYQGCNPIFWDTADDFKKMEIRTKYNIPEKYILYVGTIEKRKNLLNIVTAIDKGNIDCPLVVVGRPTDYTRLVHDYIALKQVPHIYFLHNVSNSELPVLYQMAQLFVYPSVFEGFGIPLLEAITSKIPVITSKGGCFAEAAGKSSIYIHPENIDELIFAIKNVLEDSALRLKMIEDGYSFAQQFKQNNIATNLMKVYQSIQ